MHHAMISDSEVEVITLGSPLARSLPPSVPLSLSLSLSGSTLLCQPSIWGLETTHFIAVTRHDGPARPGPLDSFPATVPAPQRQHVGRLAGLLICHGWTAREALTQFSSGAFLLLFLFVLFFFFPSLFVMWPPNSLFLQAEM